MRFSGDAFATRGVGVCVTSEGVDTPDVCFFSAAIAQTSINLLFQLCKVCGGEAMFLGRELSDRGASHVAAFLGWWGFAMGCFEVKESLAASSEKQAPRRC